MKIYAKPPRPKDLSRQSKIDMDNNSDDQSFFSKQHDAYKKSNN